MNECQCDVCLLLRHLDEQTEGRPERATTALIQTLWRVIAEGESQDQGSFLQELSDQGLDLHTYSLLRTAIKLGSWELETPPADESSEEDVEPQVLLH